MVALYVTRHRIRRLPRVRLTLISRSRLDRTWCQLGMLPKEATPAATWLIHWRLTRDKIAGTLPIMVLIVAQWWVRLCNKWQMFEFQPVAPANSTLSRPSLSRLIAIKWSSYRPRPHAQLNKPSSCRKVSKSLSKMRWETGAVWSISMCPKALIYSTDSQLTPATIK